MHTVPQVPESDRDNRLLHGLTAHFRQTKLPLHVEREVDIVRVGPLARRIARHEPLQELVEPHEATQRRIVLKNGDRVVEVREREAVAVAVKTPLKPATYLRLPLRDRWRLRGSSRLIGMRL